jgi:hypothetical protein
MVDIHDVDGCGFEAVPLDHLAAQRDLEIMRQRKFMGSLASTTTADRLFHYQKPCITLQEVGILPGRRPRLSSFRIWCASEGQ